MDHEYEDFLYCFVCGHHVPDSVAVLTIRGPRHEQCIPAPSEGVAVHDIVHPAPEGAQ